jgi:hypothetical protein
VPDPFSAAFSAPGSGRGPVRLLRADTRQNTGSVADWTAKTDTTTTKRSRILGPGPLHCVFSQITHPTSGSGRKPSKDARQQWIYLPAPEDPDTTTTLMLRGGMVIHIDRRVTR